MNSLYSLAVASPLLGILLCTRMASRLILLAVAIPLAVCINILRITGTALLADYRPDLAIGFYHSFAGWLVFLAGFLGLYLFARILHACID
jgi:exosortase/archaeosortase family protein